MATLMLTHPKTLSDVGRQAVMRSLEEWRDGGDVLLLEEGMQAGIVGGLRLTIVLMDGPLAWVRFSITVASLTELPDRFDYVDGAYVRYVTEAGQQYHTTDGDPNYIWLPA